MSEQDSSLTTLVGGEDLTAILKDGTSEAVKVRELPIRDLQKAVMSMGDDAKLIEIYCDKPSGWADRLQLRSALDILAAGNRVNEPFFVEYIQAKNDQLSRIAPGLAKKMQDPATALLNGSPGSPSDAG